MSKSEINWLLAERLSVMPANRLLALHEQALSVSQLSGDVAELGVYKGGSTVLLAQTLSHKYIHAFDNFAGLQNLSGHDAVRTALGERGHAHGDFGLDAVAQARTRKVLRAARVSFYEGPFAEQQACVAEKVFCFAHFDADTYASAMEFLEFFYPRMVRGGKLMFDDVGWPATPGVEKAIFDFFGQPPAFNMRKNYQAVIVRK